MLMSYKFCKDEKELNFEGRFLIRMHKKSTMHINEILKERLLNKERCMK